MKTQKKKLIQIITLIICLFLASSTTFAHSGRTDSSGGHRDNKNKSGLGSYHYHCGGNPPHLHSDGSCPYGNNTSSSSNDTTTQKIKDTITINNAPSTMNIGDSSAPEYRITSTEDNNYEITSSNSEVVTVGENGLLSAVGEGQATITVSTNNNSESFTITVQAIQAESITLDQGDQDLEVGTTLSVNVAIKPDNTTDKSITWGSANPDIAEYVDNAIIAKSLGETIITATTSNGLQASINIHVVEITPESIRTNKDEFKIEISSSDKIEIKILPEDAANKEYELLFDKNVIEIDDKGNITPVSEGETSITITTWNNISKSIPVIVDHIPVTEIIIDDSEISYISNNKINVDSELNLKVNIAPQNATYKDYVWETSDESVVKVIANKPEIVGEGEVTLKVISYDDVSDEITFVIEKTSLAVTIIAWIIIIAAFSGVVIGFIFIVRKVKNISHKK